MRQVVLLPIVAVCMEIMTMLPLASLVAEGVPLKDSAPPKNVIFMVTDGMGPQQMVFAREFAKALNANVTELPQDKYLLGTQETISANSRITDSAAGATAFSCGVRVDNGNVGVTPEDKPCGTVFEAASMAGYKVGTVSTSRVTHATPGSFSAHVKYRSDEDMIAHQQINNGFFHLFLGGGKKEYLPKSENPSSGRKDGRNIVNEAKAKGWKYVDSIKGLDESDSLPLLGLFADSHMDYEIDRDPEVQPSLSHMTEKALQLMSEATKDSEKGFMLMVEGSRIDMAGHGNDAWTMARDILAFEEAFVKVEEFVKKNPDTLVLTTSDHDTGGLALGWQKDPLVYPEYKWTPDCLLNLEISSEKLIKDEIWPFKKQWSEKKGSDDDLKQYLLTTMHDKLHLKESDINPGELSNVIGGTKNLTSGQDYPLQRYLGDLIQVNKCGVGYATHGHTGSEVNVYGMGPLSSKMRGHWRNLDLGKFLVETYGFDMDATTEKVKNVEIVRPEDKDPANSKIVQSKLKTLTFAHL
eukprot:Nk52_evm6s387 gene=Nk52_evmTU6s387